MRLLSKITFFAAALLLLPFAAFAQDGTIAGMITDAKTGEPVPGVNVLIDELGVGGATDAEGLYEITDVPAGDYTLMASFVGYEDFEQAVSVSAGETVEVDIALQPSVAALQEVVVEGYRVDQDPEPTGAASEVSGQVVAESNVQTATEALQGRASGVRISSTSGQPGAAFDIQVRGQSSITAGTEPLYIVDGVQMNTESNANEANLSPLAGLDPNSIESIRVLKDASATAIYGARAANGVVLITTRGGTSGETRVSFTGQLGTVGPLREFDGLSASEWAEYTFLQAENAGYTREQIAAAYAIPSTNPSEVTGPDWYDATHQTPLTQSYNLTLNGGTDDTRFYIGGSYERDHGQVIESYLNQVGLRVNLDHDVSDVFSLGTKVNLSTMELSGSISDGAWINSPFWASYQIRPHFQIYNEPGNPDSGFNYFNTSAAGAFSYNLVANEVLNTQETNANQLIGSVNATWRIAPWLIARSLVGVQHEDLSEKDRRDPRIPQNAGTGGSAFVSSTRETAFNASQTFNYDFALGDAHDLSGLVGAEYRREYYQFSGAGGEGFPFYLFQNLANTATPTSATEEETESRILSFFGDAEYGYDDRYIARGTIRYDGSSRFGADTRFGLFGSAGLAWRISNEAFLDDADFLSDLKLRASWGVLGNSEIGNFISRRLYGGGGEYVGQPGLTPTSLGNQQLTWEESEQINVGLDYGLFDNRVTGSFNVYRKTTDDLLLGRDLPSSSGFGSVIENVGTIRNQGIEIDLSTINLDVAGFRWDTDFNITFQESEVLDLIGDDEELYDYTQPGGGLYRVGEPLNLNSRVPWAGVNPADGRPLYLDADGNLTYTVGGQDAERTFGNVLADFYGGLGNTFSYGGATLDVFFQYDYGRQTFNNDRYFIDGTGTYNHTTAVLDHWEEPGDVAERPLPYLGVRPGGGSPYGDGYYYSSVFIENASYIRLKRLRLSYNLPAALTGSLGMQNASIFGMATNLVTWTNYTGLDPEQVGTAIGQYPQNKRFTAGLQLTF